MREAGLVMVRYADDAVVLCRSREEAESALARLRAWVSENGLMLHPDKTHVGDCREDGQGFEFLGYRFEAGRRLVRKKSLTALRDKVRARTPRNRGGSIESVIASLNPTLKGWCAYFKQAHRFTFSSVDGFIRRRLRAMLRKQKHRPGQGRCLNDHTMAKFLLRQSWAVHDVRSSSSGAPIPVRKQLTGAPVAGELHSGCGGRGRRAPFPTPIPRGSRRVCHRPLRGDEFRAADVADGSEAASRFRDQVARQPGLKPGSQAATDRPVRQYRCALSAVLAAPFLNPLRTGNSNALFLPKAPRQCS